VVVLLSLVAATAFGLGAVLQQKGTVETAGQDAGVRFLASLLRRPVWLLGGAVTAVGGLCQALALREGTLAGVQALTTLSLVIALPFGVWLTDQRLTRLVWGGAAAATAGIVLFVAVGAPQNGTGPPGGEGWAVAIGSVVVLVTVLARAGRGRSGSVQAICFGAAAGLGYGLASALMKAITYRFRGGALAVLGSWQLYALIGAGLLGLVMGQSALRAGVLAPAMAATNATTLLTSVVLGLTVFGESFARGPGHLAAVVGGLGLALLGVVLLARAPSAAPAAGNQGTSSGERTTDRSPLSPA
jgi:drug/metabolite transporter (DMT)-like permease